MTDRLQRLLYTSRRRTADPGRDIADILEVSWRHNRRLQITGVLMYTASGFAQILEGPRSHLEATFERIQNDDRHHGVTVTDFAAIEGRIFSRWSMGLVGGRHLGDASLARVVLEFSETSRVEMDDLSRRLRDTLVEEEAHGRLRRDPRPEPHGPVSGRS